MTAKLSVLRKGYRFDVAERSQEVAEFCAGRVSPRGGAFAWPESADGFEPPAAGRYDVVSCFFRLEGLREADRTALVAEMTRWLKPGGRLLIAYVSARSYHGLTEKLRARRGGPKGVEYVLSPDPNIGPFEPLRPGAVQQLAKDAGLEITARFGAQAAPPHEELDFRTRNMRPASGKILRGIAAMARAFEKIPGATSGRGRFQFLIARRPQ